MALKEGEGILIHPGWRVYYEFSAERRSIHEELAAAHLALRPAPHSPSYPPLAENAFAEPEATGPWPAFTGSM